MTGKRATFEVKDAGMGPLDIGSVAVGCHIDWDRERNLWKITGGDVSPIWDEDQVRGALLHFELRFAR